MGTQNFRLIPELKQFYSFIFLEICKMMSLLWVLMIGVAIADDCDVPLIDITFGGIASSKTETFEECKALCRDVDE